MLSRNDLVGAWSLKSFETDMGSGFVPWGKAVEGFLLYSASGNVSAAINRNIGKPEFHPENDSLFYAGVFTLNGETVSHHVRVASSASRIGMTFVRTARIQEGELTLTGAGEKGGTFRLVWKKL